MKLPTRMAALAVWPVALCAQDTGPVEPAPSADAPTRYRVEVIVFAHEQRDPTEEYLEVIPQQSQFVPRAEIPARRYVDDLMLRSIERQVDGSIEADPDAAVLPPFSDVLAIDQFRRGPEEAHLRILSPDELQLQTSMARLGRLGGYTPLFHGGWEQDGLAEEQAIALDVAQLGSTNPIGTIRLHVSRYLHARVDLAYRPPFGLAGPAAAPGDGLAAFDVPSATSHAPSGPPRYYLYEERRLFRGEVNYLDHPAFGVLLLVTLAPAPSGPAEPANGIAPSA